ncbi:hypothetical protein F2Q70_00041920 [Brassica cretica]|uniref:Uncharacterized protein n=1 Tax=Brassica cretica TaxID=69181 RepID=A0A8S9MEC9_BRACR|nr:hypothetical protein F2Q70_00041920 [Brassica cretica]KAF2618390.1 hypothetical protein F2Q68_00042584 [Brassica cretica]
MATTADSDSATAAGTCVNETNSPGLSSKGIRAGCSSAEFVIVHEAKNGSQSPSLGNAWGSSSSDAQKAVIQESDDDTWGAEDSPVRESSTDIQASTWRSATSNTPTLTSVNRWSVLEPEKPLVKIEWSSSSKSAGKQLVESSREGVVDD